MNKEREFILSQSLLMVFVYLATGKSIYDTFAYKLVTGDSFTYTLSLYGVIDKADNNYFRTLLSMATGGSPNLASLHAILVSFFSPILIKEPHSIVFVNFVILLIAIFFLRTLLIKANFSESIATVAPMIIWFLPFNYALGESSSMPIALHSMMPDPLFLWMMCIASVAAVLYLSWPESTVYAYSSAATLGLACWARGNSFAYIAPVMFAILVVILSKVITQKNIKRTLTNLVAWTLITAGLLAFFYFPHYQRIYSYYSHTHAVNIDVATLDSIVRGAGWISRNLPGAFFTRETDSLATSVISYGAHIYFMIILFYTFFRRITTESQLVINMSVYFSSFYYLSCMTMGSISLGPIYSTQSFHVLHPFAPPLLAVIITIVIITASILKKMRYDDYPHKHHVMTILYLIAIAYSYSITHFYTFKGVTKNNITESTVYGIDYRNLSSSFMDATRGKSVAFLWYNVISLPGIEYYNQQLSRHDPRKTLPSFILSEVNFAFAAAVDPIKHLSREKFQENCRKLLFDSDFLVVPENVDYYKTSNLWPCPIKVYHADLAALFNAHDSPNYIVRAVFLEPMGQRILLLEKVSDPSLAGERLFPKIWGTPSQQMLKEFPGVPIFGYVYNPKSFDSIYSAAGLKDDSFDSFAELCRGESIGIMHSYSPQFVDMYKISSGSHTPESIDRAPMKWTLYGSIDGESWQEIDKQTLSKRWEKSETREFVIASPGIFTQFKFVFTKDPIACMRIYGIHFYSSNRNITNEFSNRLDIF